VGKDEEIRRAVRGAAADGQAACKTLLAVANRLGVPPRRVGQACNEVGVKVRACQLGCFR
jgi:hypothetical protein